MILFITPNPCIERTYEIPEFTANHVFRVDQTDSFTNVGGKGINAARVAAQFSTEVLSLSWAGKNQLRWIENQLIKEDVPHRLIPTVSDTRSTINILHRGRKTEIIEAGISLTNEDGERLLDELKVLLPQVKLLAVCGSYPPGISETHLSQIVQLAEQFQTRILVDSKGAGFNKLLQSNLPLWAIKPNNDEASEILKKEIKIGDEADAVRELLKFNIENVIISCGKRGAWLGNKNGIEFIQSPVVDEVSPVGSGDSLVGTFCAQYINGLIIDEAMRWGVAAGAVNATQIKSAFCTKDEIEKYFIASFG